MALRVLGVASEAFPLIKTGGLADVVGALPAALAAEDVAVTTLLPGYPAVMAAAGEAPVVIDLPDRFGPARLRRANSGALDLLVLDAPQHFARPGNPYTAPDGSAWEDNGIRFAALGFATAEAAVALGFDAVHAHDWQAGLAGAYLRHTAPRRVPVAFTVHNLAFQGHFPPALFPHLGLPPVAYNVEGLEYFGGIGFLKAGLWYADRITTVSPTYAAEIRTPAGGMGLDGLLRGRAEVVTGILNGLDDTAWNPAADPLLVTRFSAADPSPRVANRAALQARFGLDADPEAPLFAFVGRFAWQKGVDLVLEALPALVAAGGQLAVLGTADPALEALCLSAAAAHPGRVGVHIELNEGLARLCYGGADAILVPSRFEPCGLAQLCALRYGAPPVVAFTGGLADTVIDANEMALAAGCATGLQFPSGDAAMLAAALQRAAVLIHDRGTWARIRANAMASDVSWRRSAQRYAALFREIAAADG